MGIKLTITCDTCGANVVPVNDEPPFSVNLTVMAPGRIYNKRAFCSEECMRKWVWGVLVVQSRESDETTLAELLAVACKKRDDALVELKQLRAQQGREPSDTWTAEKLKTITWEEIRKIAQAIPSAPRVRICDLAQYMIDQRACERCTHPRRIHTLAGQGCNSPSGTCSCSMFIPSGGLL